MTAPTAASLSAARRARELDQLASGPPVDVLVVGGGITGAGVALDAASRGISVALVERHDLAFGTSRWSSKLVHGGLRYLASGQVGVAYESARERHRLMTVIAPHLVHPMPFVVPLDDALPPVEGAVTQAAFVVAESLRLAAGTRGRLLPRARRISEVEARSLVPAAGPMRGAFLHWDGQLEDDARLVVAVARTAAAYGARVLTRCDATRVDGDGADVVDTLTGRSLRVRARAVVCATGVWAGQTSPGVRLRPSRGSHLVVPSSVLGYPRAGYTVHVAGTSNRWVFATPRPDGTALVGLTDEPVTGEPADEPVVPAGDESYLLETISRALVRPLTSADVIGRFAGLRPLLAGRSGSTADLSRRHALVEAEGVVTVVGGKLTTYRVMAEHAVDRVAARLGLTTPCRTKQLPLVGADMSAVPAGIAPRLLRRYGGDAPAVVAEAADREGLLDDIAPGVPVSAAELLFGLHHEGALTAADLLDRRTRLGLVPAWREAAEPVVQALLADAAPPTERVVPVTAG